jgi:hypothetical protein
MHLFLKERYGLLTISTFIVHLRHDTPSHQQKKNTKNSVAHLLMYKVFPSLTILLLCLDVNRLALQHDEFVGVLYW